jgi:hypothetical protein
MKGHNLHCKFMYMKLISSLTFNCAQRMTPRNNSCCSIVSDSTDGSNAKCNTKAEIQELTISFRLQSWSFTTYGIGQSKQWLLHAGRLRGQSLCPGRGKIFILSMSSRPVLGPTQPPIQWVQGALSPGGWNGRSVKLTNGLELVPWWRIRGSIHPLSHIHSTAWYLIS